MADLPIYSRLLEHIFRHFSSWQAGMTTINDFATSYMNQSLPFGGVKESGFDKFAGVEGLRGVCLAKSVCEDRCSFNIWIQTSYYNHQLKVFRHHGCFQRQETIICLEHVQTVSWLGDNSCPTEFPSQSIRLMLVVCLQRSRLG